MKIVLCHVAGTNLGDVVIERCVEYLLKRILPDTDPRHCEIRRLNIGQQPPLSAPETVERGWRRWVLDRLEPHHKNLWTVLAWRWSVARRDFIRNECGKLDGADVVVFVGGGIIKFHRQKFHMYISEIVSRCDRARVPVLFNAVGVEGYDVRNRYCRFLKGALNRPCVKLMTTRDDVDVLNRDYRVTAKWTAVRVADPALWTPEAFGVTRMVDGLNRIGLNVIRPEIFKDYLYDVAADDLIGLYAGLVRRLMATGRSVELFSNGGMRDGAFIDDVLTAVPEFRGDPRLTIFKPVSADELVGRIARYERFLAVRLHAAIIGTSLGVPNVSLVWNRKQLLFGEAVGLRENFLTKEGFVVDTVLIRLLGAKGYVGDVVFKDSVLSTLRAGLKDAGIRPGAV